MATGPSSTLLAQPANPRQRSLPSVARSPAASWCGLLSPRIASHQKQDRRCRFARPIWAGLRHFVVSCSYYPLRDDRRSARRRNGHPCPPWYTNARAHCSKGGGSDLFTPAERAHSRSAQKQADGAADWSWWRTAATLLCPPELRRTDEATWASVALVPEWTRSHKTYPQRQMASACLLRTERAPDFSTDTRAAQRTRLEIPGP